MASNQNPAHLSQSIEANQKRSSPNKRERFTCVSCSIPTHAPSGTQRVIERLCKECFGKKEDRRENTLNELTGHEWATLSKSVEQYNGKRTEKQRLHGAAFPASLAESQIKIYTKKDDLVFDPFVGVGTTMEVAEYLGRRSVGIELNPEFTQLVEADLENKSRHRVICGDARNLNNYVARESVDFIITSPPYATLLKTVKGNFAYKWREHSDINIVPNPRPYSEHDKDLGNLSYAEFMDALTNILRQTYEVLKEDSYAVWVVKDYRDTKSNVPLVNFHSDVIRAAEYAQFTLWDIRVYDQTKYRPLVVLGYPSRNYYLNIGHSYILVFKKVAFS